jgi:hypothetical protein
MKKSAGFLVGVFVFLGMLGCAKIDMQSLSADQITTGQPVIIWEPAYSKWSEISRNQVKSIIAQTLSEMDAIPPTSTLDDPILEKILKLHGVNGIFTGHDGKTYRGRGEIGGHLRQFQKNIKNLRGDLKAVYAKEFTDVLNSSKPSPEDIVHSVHLIFSWAYILNDKAVDPPSSTTFRHTRVCDWSNDY